MSRGIDVSHHQDVIDWRKVAADGVDFAICKATDGSSFTDPQWVRNREGAHGVGIPVGAYHFARPGRHEPVAEARFFLSRAQPVEGELVPSLDLEFTLLSKTDTTRWALEWLTVVEDAIGAIPMIYTRASWVEEHMVPDPALARHPLWVAHFTNKPAPRISQPWDAWRLWQHSETGTTQGIVGACDQDRLAEDAVLPFFGRGSRSGHPLEEDPLMALTDAEQKELLEKVRGMDLRVVELQKEVVGLKDDMGQSRMDRLVKRVDELRGMLKT